MKATEKTEKPSWAEIVGEDRRIECQECGALIAIASNGDIAVVDQQAVLSLDFMSGFCRRCK